MESILSLVAGWVSVKEMKALQGACMRTSTLAREQHVRSSCPAWMIKCGKNCQMNGKEICGKKKKVLLCEYKLNRDEHPKNKTRQLPIEKSELTEVLQ